MKIFIDLGAYKGNMIKKAYDRFPDFDLFVGFEPVPDLYDKIKQRFTLNDKIEINKYAVGVENKSNVKLYLNSRIKKNGLFIGKGSTLFVNKIYGGKIDKDKYILVNMIDFSEYLFDNFKENDYIILKIDIEGKEYDLLEHLISTGNICYINKIYCEWHHSKISDKNINKTRHKALIKKLNKLGFNLTGNNRKDEYCKVHKG